MVGEGGSRCCQKQGMGMVCIRNYLGFVFKNVDP